MPKGNPGLAKPWLYKFCIVDSCDRHSETKESLCLMHWKRLKRNGTTNRVNTIQGKTCSIEGCEKPSDTRNLCTAHYNNWLRHGNPLHKRTMRKVTRIKISETMKGRPQIHLRSKEVRQKALKALIKSPNKQEIRLLEIISEQGFPFEYTGDGSCIIGKLCPDFYAKEDSKIIELFGRTYHDPEVSFFDVPEIGQRLPRIKYYKNRGYDCLVIWDDELSGKTAVISKINTLLYGENKLPE